MQMQMTDENRSKLEELQEVLAKKFELEAQIQEKPKSLDSGKESLAQFRKEFIKKNAEYDAEKSKVSSLRTELEAAEKERENAERSMEDTSSHREFEILQKQIDDAHAREDDLRHSLLKEEKILSELKDELESEEGNISLTESEVNENESKINLELAELNKQLDECNASEEKLSEGFPEEILFKFKRIIQRNRKGIVAVKSGVCEGCHMILPADFANRVRRADDTYFCPYCSRILFYEEGEKLDVTWNDADDSGSLLGEIDYDDPDFGGYDESGSGYDDDSENEESSSDYED